MWESQRIVTSFVLSADGDRIAIGLEEGLYVIEVTRDGECMGRSGRPRGHRQGQHWGCTGINVDSLESPQGETGP